LGILVVNVTGSLALGILVGLGTTQVPAALATILGTGLIGGYTTFSTVSVETVLLADRADKSAAAANLIGTLALALTAAALGMLAGAWAAAGFGG
jgi:CrcB protein